jgi:hypothetical protein
VIPYKGGKAMKSALKWDVFVSSQIPAVTGDLPPGVTEMKWSPISSTLISGERDAVLVDTFITLEQNRALAEWVVASGKNLTTIYVDPSCSSGCGIGQFCGCARAPDRFLRPACDHSGEESR